MNSLLFPKATRELLSVLSEHKDDPAPIIDEYLKQFSVKCGRSFMTSLTSSSTLFTDEELLERMRENQS